MSPHMLQAPFGALDALSPVFYHHHYQQQQQQQQVAALLLLQQQQQHLLRQPPSAPLPLVRPVEPSPGHQQQQLLGDRALAANAFELMARVGARAARRPAAQYGRRVFSSTRRWHSWRSCARAACCSTRRCCRRRRWTRAVPGRYPPPLEPTPCRPSSTPRQLCWAEASVTCYGSYWASSRPRQVTRRGSLIRHRTFLPWNS